MTEEHPFLELPLPSVDDHIRFKEWKKQKQEEEEEKKKDQGHVIIIDI